MDGWTCLLTALLAGSNFPDSVGGIKAQGGCRKGGTPSLAMGNRRVEFFGKSKGQDYFILHHALRGIPNF